MSGVYEPGFWVVSCCSRHIRITTRTQQTLMLLIISELTQNRIWISKCIYELYVYIFNPYPILVRSAYYYVAALLSFVLEFMLMHSLSTQGNAGVLHVPAYNHDKPPKVVIYFLWTCAVYRITFLTGCAYRHTRSRPVVGAGDLLCRQYRGYKE